MSEQQPQQNTQPVFLIEKIYTKDISLEIPNAPQVFRMSGEPSIDMNVATDAKAVEEGFFDCTVGVTVTAKLPDGKLAFVCEVKQSAVMRIQNVPEEELDAILGIACPNIIFPYARALISDITTKAGFPPIILAPINFEFLYFQRQDEMAATEEQIKIANDQKQKLTQ